MNDEKNKIVIAEILEVLKKHEITYRQLYLLFEEVTDEFRNLAGIKKD